MNKAPRPLSPITYLARNGGKTIPLTAVIVLAVLLVTAIISLINSIPFSIRTIYAYSSQMLGIGPRGDPNLTPELVEHVRKKCPVPISRIALCRATPSQVRSIVGKWPFACLGFEQSDLKFFLERLHVQGIEGRLPRPGAPEAIIAEAVARNLHLKIGSNLLSPDQNESYSPKEVKVVGIGRTDQWFMAVDIEYMREFHFPPVDVALVFAKDIQRQDELDRWAGKEFKGNRAQIFAYYQVEKQTNEMFTTLYKILNVVIGTLVLVITIMMGMLINIYQSQRLVEFGLLQALGYTKKALLGRVLRETITVIFLGWGFGLALGFLGLFIVKKTLMDPNAYALNLFDRSAFLYTLMVPISILLIAIYTVIWRFRKFDPVGVVERRLV